MTSPEDAAITRAVLDYFEGWFDGNASRMERALHPGLAKRSLEADAPGTEALDETTAQQMIELTAQGRGKGRDVPDRGIRVRVDDVAGHIATATVHSAVYTEYLHLVRTRDGWKIVNTLWKFA
jgi:hypothetical protein